jgi:biopolymer transport protein ExbD
MKRRSQGLSAAKTRPNITPLADVTMTLIIVFLIAMPALMWSGIRVNATQATTARHETVPQSEVEGELIVISVDPSGIRLDGEDITFDDLGPAIKARTEANGSSTVVVVPDDEVLLASVVDVLDTAKGAGAEKIALLDRVK